MHLPHNFRRNGKGIGTVFAMVFFLLIVMLVFASFMVILNQNTGLEQTVIQTRQIDNDRATEQLSISPRADGTSLFTVDADANTVTVKVILNNTGTLPVQLIRLWVKDVTNSGAASALVSIEDGSLTQGQANPTYIGVVTFSETVQIGSADKFIFWFETSRGNQFTLDQSSGGSPSDFNRLLSGAMGDFIPDYDSFQWAEVAQDFIDDKASIGSWNTGWIIPNENDPFNWHHDWWHHHSSDESPYIIFRLNLTYFGTDPIRIDQKTGIWITSLLDSSGHHYTPFDVNLYVALPTPNNPNSISPYTLGNEVYVTPSPNGTPVTLYFAINDNPVSWHDEHHHHFPIDQNLGVRVDTLPSSASLSMTIYGMSPSNYSQTFPLYSIMTRPFPKITSIDPPTGPVDTPITVNGENFALLNPLKIYYDNVLMTSSSLTTDSSGGFSVQFHIPASSFGNHLITATDANGNTVNANFAVTSSITLDKSSASIGSTVTVSGKGFSASTSQLPKTVTITLARLGVVTSIDVITPTDGSGSFTAFFNVPEVIVGSYTVTATDSLNSLITASAQLIVTPGVIDHFTISPCPTSVTAGSNFGGSYNVLVTAYDAYGNLKTDYTGQVYFTSTDPQATLPFTSTSRYTFTSGDNGDHSFTGTGFTLKTAGSQTITVSDYSSGIQITCNTITVNPGIANNFVVAGFPDPVTAGIAGSVTVTTKDGFGNIVPSYRGTVRFTSSDTVAILPSNYAFVLGDNGIHTFTNGVTLKTAGDRSITATDTTTGAITGSQTGITVSAAGVTSFVVNAVGGGNILAQTAGVAFNVNVTAVDSFDNRVTGYAGTVGFTSSDGAAGLPSTSDLSSGMGTFSVTLKTVGSGSQTITATDTVTSTLKGTSAAIVVIHGSAVSVTVGPVTASITAGGTQAFTATASDAYSNTWSVTSSVTWSIASGAVGSVSSGGLATATKVGTWTVTAALSGASSGTAQLTVTAAVGTSFVVNAVGGGSIPAQTAGVAFNVNVTAVDAFGNWATGYAGTVRFTSSDVAAVLPGNSLLTSGMGTFSVTLKSVGSGSQTVTATDTVTASITGTSVAITVNAAGAAKLVFIAPIPSTVAHRTETSTFTVQRQDPYGNPVATGITIVNLSDNSGSGRFRDLQGNTVTSISIASNSNTVVFTWQYRGYSAYGSVTITAQASGLTSATTNINVT
jgi:hypothetical protein